MFRAYMPLLRVSSSALTLAVRSCRVAGVQRSCAKHFTVEFYTVVMRLTFILIIINIPPPLTLSFQPSFSTNPSHRSLPVVLQD